MKLIYKQLAADGNKLSNTTRTVMKLSRSFFIVISVFIFITACNGSQSNSLPDFSQTSSITITDNWSGFNTASPINSVYSIDGSGGNFDGTAYFSVGGMFHEAQEATNSISVPTAVINSFLQKLAEARPEAGNYEPDLQRTDDYPEIIIHLVYGSEETIEFHTTSQGNKHIPWQVTYNDNSYIIKSGEPAQALEMLRPYLSQDTLQNLIRLAQ